MISNQASAMMSHDTLCPSMSQHVYTTVCVCAAQMTSNHACLLSAAHRIVQLSSIEWLIHDVSHVLSAERDELAWIADIGEGGLPGWSLASSQDLGRELFKIRAYHDSMPVLQPGSMWLKAQAHSVHSQRRNVLRSQVH